MVQIENDNQTQYSIETPPAQSEEAPPRPATHERQADVFDNRELCWLAFNRRVLAEATNAENPLLERVRFLSITGSNLDEFFMVRYASLRHRTYRGRALRDPSGMAPAEQVTRVAEDARRFMGEQMDVLTRDLMPDLRAAGLSIVPLSALGGEGGQWAETVFRRDMLPRLEACIAARRADFPHVAGRALQLGMLLEREDAPGEPVLATARLPAGMPRLWRLPEALGAGYALAEEIIAAHAALLVPGYRVLGCWPYRVTRDEDYVVADHVTGNLVAATKRSLRRRKTGAIVRLEVDARAPKAFTSLLCEALSMRLDAVFPVEGPLDLTFLSRELYDIAGLEAMRYPACEGMEPAALRDAPNVFCVLRGRDVFLHHPYDSFDAVQRFVREAAADPRVLAINMTLYRVSGHSPVIRALCDAAEAGKRVTVLLELKARFDEENNIRWAEVLSRAGCEVIYGMPRLKTHSKITLVVRREEQGVARYMHLGTGNYNDVTARQYTDMGLLTADPALGEDAQAFFNMITGFSREPAMHRLIYAPRMLRQSLTALIEAEITHARAGRPCGIFAKMNSLVDPGIIHLLYDASAAGVPVRLIVRGVCCLRPGVPGLSENIEVRSIIGRFLEHSRVFRFENGGDAKLYLSSADWMPRNLNRRVELMFPVMDTDVRRRVMEVLDTQWRDNVKAWRQLPDGTYERMPADGERVNAQEVLLYREEV